MGNEVGIRESRDDQLDRAAAMPHRQLAGDNRLDARLEHTVGRLFFEGTITATQYRAGLRYGELVLMYLESIGAPAPYGGDTGALQDDECYRRKILMAQARDILSRAAVAHNIPPRQVIRAVDRVTVYSESPNDLRALRVGLSALAGE